MRLESLSLLVCCAVVTFCGCSKRQTALASRTPEALTPTAKPTTMTIDPCSLLTSEEIESVQGQPVIDTHPSSQSARGLVVSQCFFELPTAVNSITVALFQNSDRVGGAGVKEFWRATFHGSDESSHAGGEPDRLGRTEEHETKSPPEKMEELGDEAFWTANPMTNALYVLKGERFVRISVGGAGDIAAKRSKARTLA
jgi:hypothetical protein